MKHFIEAQWKYFQALFNNRLGPDRKSPPSEIELAFIKARELIFMLGNQESTVDISDADVSELVMLIRKVREGEQNALSWGYRRNA